VVWVRAGGADIARFGEARPLAPGSPTNKCRHSEKPAGLVTSWQLWVRIGAMPDHAAQKLNAICRTISERMHNQYSLGYYSPKRQGSQWRGVRIETRVQRLRVLPSKRGYYPEAPAQ